MIGKYSYTERPGEDANLPAPLPGAAYPYDERPDRSEYEDEEGLDRTNDYIVGPPGYEHGQPPPGRVMPMPGLADDEMYRKPQQFDPADTNRDGIVDEIERWMAHQRMGPDEIKRDWIEQNVWKRGLTVDQVTGEIVDPHSGQVVGRMPQFTD